MAMSGFYPRLATLRFLICNFKVCNFRRTNAILDCLCRFVATETRKPSPFPAFVKLRFNEVKSQNPAMKATEIMKKLSEMYKATPPTEIAKLTLSSPVISAKSQEEKSEDRKKLQVAISIGLFKFAKFCLESYLFAVLVGIDF